MVFCVSMFAWFVLSWVGPLGGLRAAFLLVAILSGGWLLYRVLRWLAEKAIWRLRHRLIVTYLFVAVAPVVLLILLGGLVATSLLLQMSMNGVTAGLSAREAELRAVAGVIAKLDVPSRAAELRPLIDPYFTTRYPGLNVVLRERGPQVRLPADAEAPVPPASSESGSGVVERDGNYFLWGYHSMRDGYVSITAPLNQTLLGQIAPKLVLGAPRGPFWFTVLRAAEWQAPGVPARDVVLSQERQGADIIASVFNSATDIAQGGVRSLLIAAGVLFLLVEVICWGIGVTMTRTITGTVHHLYEGTHRVMEGKFSHRIPEGGRDQLAEVGSSFNRMTAHLEQLLAVEKEQERLQAEIEIAREVQNQLYPRSLERSPHLRVAASFHSARLVSGDYFDCESAHDGRLALVIGDVAGKGISAALLMASLQSSLRTQLALDEVQSAPQIVTRLNQHLCNSTTTEKYATFCLGLYDEQTSVITYTNAGHIPPVLIRAGVTQRFDVNRTVVGVFPSAEYESSSLTLLPGDLLALFTDGVTEPENEFEEMFGEARLIDLLTKNAHRGEQEIIALVLDAIRQWTGSDELQDDITLMLARRT